MAVISDVGEEADLSAFSAGASDAEHAHAVLALAQQLNTASSPQTHVDVAAYTASLRTHLSSAASTAQRITAFDFLTALALVHPHTAYHILLGPPTPLLHQCTAAANIHEEHGDDQLAFHFAAMLAAIADWGPSRTQLAAASAAHIHAWAATAVNNAHTTADPSPHTALLAGLLILKLASPNSSSSAATSPLDPAQASQRRQQATTLAPQLYALAKQEVNHRSSSSAQLNRPSRSALLAALETIAYLSIFNPNSTSSSSKTPIKDQITSDPDLLKGLVHLALRATAAQSHDSAVQFTIASIFEHLSAYPARLTSEQKQVERLRKMAAHKQRQAERNAAGAASSGTPTSKEEEEEEEDTRAQHAQAEARCTRLLRAGIISALVSMSTSSASASASLRTSTSTDEPQQQEARPPLQVALAATLAALTMRQDRRTRGQIAQQGGAKALLMLSNRELDRYRTSSPRRKTASTEESGGKNVGGELDIVPLQALARVCISLDPQLLFGPTSSSSSSTTTTGARTAAGPIVALPALCTLFLHPSAESDTLARFEAALALTNLSSVHPDLASTVSAFSLDTLLAGRREQEEEEEKAPSVLEMLDARLFTEDHLMTRRAYVELLCNLVQCESAYRIWTGEEEDESASSPGAEERRRAVRSSAQRGIHILAALCAPVDAPAEQQHAKESSLPTRLAAAGTLATLCSSPSACERTLCLGIRSLNTLARLLAPVRPKNPSSSSSSSSSSSASQGGAIASSDRFTELSKEEAEEEEEEDDDDKTAVEHGERTTSAGVEVNEDDDQWTMTDVEEIELLEAEDADLESFRPPSSSSSDDDDTTPNPAAPKLAQAQLAIRGATIANSLLQYLHWRNQQQQPPSSSSSQKKRTSQLARRLERAGMLDALREEVQGAIGELRLGESAAERSVGAGEVMGIRREVVRLCLDSLKVWGGLGLRSG
ncbi:unnamed protein product [Tilletia controversa]|nr:unnamed protein product [Tilletia controversa]CAD6911509.1 unnamed protein product [Tilletia controversa]CAD6975707.1 unnamed protein product [Tilletia controversa]CAD6979567.1 unnamed protein product [Tilletia controversa]